MSPDLIIATVADYYHLSTDEVRARRRIPYVLHAREVAVYLCRQLMPAMSYEMLTRFFDYQYRGTLVDCRKRAKDRLADEQGEILRRQMEEIMEIVRYRRTDDYHR